MYTTIYCFIKGDDFMPRVSPFHSKLPGTSVHHNNSKCTEGNNIETYNRESGTGGLPLCDHCKRLNGEGK